MVNCIYCFIHTHAWFWGNNWSCGLRLSLIVVEMHIYDFHTPYELIGGDGGGGAGGDGGGGAGGAGG